MYMYMYPCKPMSCSTCVCVHVHVYNVLQYSEVFVLNNKDKVCVLGTYILALYIYNTGFINELSITSFTVRVLRKGKASLFL